MLFEIRVKENKIIFSKELLKDNLIYLNEHFRKYGYPPLNYSDIERLVDSGETVVYKENDGTYIKIIDSKHIKQKSILREININKLLSD